MNSEVTQRPHPLMGMIIRPRDTVRDILDTDPGYHMHTMAFAGGAATQLLGYLIDPFFFGGSLAGQALLGGVSGLVGVYLSGAIYTWVGRLLGGRATAAEMRTALAWAYVPALWVAALMGLLALLGVTSWTVLLGIVAVTELWLWVVQLKAIGEAHDFSSWRALGMMVIIAFAVMLIIAVLIGVVAALLGPALATPEAYHFVSA